MKTQTKLPLLFILVLALLQVQNSIAQQDSIAMKYASTITVEDLKEDLTILSSDALEGRETGKRGQKMAAAYIKTHFEELGLTGPVTNSSSPYYQDVHLKTSKPGDIYVKFGDTRLNNIEDFLYYGETYNIDEVTTDLVFAGAGTKADFEGLSIEGKSVLINTTERPVRQAALKIVQENGGKMLFVIYADDEAGYETYYNTYKNYLNKEKIGLDKGENAEEAGIIFVSPTSGSAMFGRTFEQMQKAIADKAEGKKKAFKKFKSQEVSYKIEFTSNKIISENVLGYLEGTDLKDEILILTAHYDHEGIKNGEIYNGADDDGSGTVAVMDIAEAFAIAKSEGYGPRRSILFMPVTGEEKGLLGSAYYADNPIFPLENTMADLNIDMIGRKGYGKEENDNYVYVIGSDRLSSELHTISENANNLYLDLELDYTYNDENDKNRFYYRSDHYNFAKKNIPIIFYFNGAHKDYHKPTDTVDKIEFELMRKRTQLVFYTAWEIVNRDGRLIVDKDQEDKVSK